VAVAPAGGGRGCGEEGLDLVHGVSGKGFVGPALWPRIETTAQFADFVAAETAKWGKLIREVGIRAD
jgi:hypothetical protein